MIIDNYYHTSKDKKLKTNVRINNAFQLNNMVNAKHLPSELR